MKKLLLSAMVLLATCIAAQAQSDYLPLVREGVRWHYVKQYYGIEELQPNVSYYYEFRGDTIVDGKTFKKCYMSSPEPGESGLVALMREEDRKVYRKYVGDDDEAKLIYDFNTSELYINNWEHYFIVYHALENIDIQGVDCKRYQFTRYYDKDDKVFKFVEGVGVDYDYLSYHGDLLYPLMGRCTCEFEIIYYLDCLTDLNGNVLYKSNIVSAITDVKADGKQGNDRYYNLMGQPVSSPTQGIYIHNGKKVIVK